MDAVSEGGAGPPSTPCAAGSALAKRSNLPCRDCRGSLSLSFFRHGGKAQGRGSPANASRGHYVHHYIAGVAPNGFKAVMDETPDKLVQEPSNRPQGDE